MTATETAAAAATRPAARRPVGVARQTLRLTRTEFTLIYRYRTALFFVLFPLVFVALAAAGQGPSLLEGVSAAEFSVAGTPAAIAMMIGIMHVSNAYAARREQLILKRYRASGVSPYAMFGATTLSVVAVTAALTLVAGAVMAGMYGTLPADPVLVAAGVLLTAVTMSLLGAAMTRLAANAESAQMLSMVPFLGLYASGGLMIPLDVFPEGVATVGRLLPMAPAVDLVRAGYFGRDLFGGVDGAEAATGLDLWAAALPALGVCAVWVGIAVFSLRYFRWDPRQPK
ncbi:ABC transporter permease [Streptomonospora nanhaiensis]|uniref:ABC transporter permease n=1 Tax=Streptomonospora nanhaiensis TaxID=1323731 RepID=UPI001C9998AE|nr:ABC transporter permease [Streptomonospora nanhaiensis]MBX9387255.1 ABC transporter permease [Streptomonospora nanhaiensis]